MIILDFLFALCTAILFACFLTFFLRREGPGPMSGLLFFTVLICFVVWAVGLTVTPQGPILWGVPWLAFLFTGMLVAMVLAAAVPPRKLPKTPDDASRAAVKAVATSVGLFFYLTVFVLICLIFFYYLRRYDMLA